MTSDADRLRDERAGRLEDAVASLSDRLRAVELRIAWACGGVAVVSSLVSLLSPFVHAWVRGWGQR